MNAIYNCLKEQQQQNRKIYYLKNIIAWVFSNTKSFNMIFDV